MRMVFIFIQSTIYYSIEEGCGGMVYALHKSSNTIVDITHAIGSACLSVLLVYAYDHVDIRDCIRLNVIDDGGASLKFYRGVGIDDRMLITT